MLNFKFITYSIPLLGYETLNFTSAKHKTGKFWTFLKTFEKDGTLNLAWHVCIVHAWVAHLMMIWNTTKSCGPPSFIVEVMHDQSFQLAIDRLPAQSLRERRSEGKKGTTKQNKLIWILNQSTNFNTKGFDPPVALLFFQHKRSIISPTKSLYHFRLTFIHKECAQHLSFNKYSCT